MGGSGSGRRREKTTVEEGLILSAATLQSGKLLRLGSGAVGSLAWTRTATGETSSSISYEVNTLNQADPWIRLSYTVRRNKEDVDFRVRLTTTPLPWGGVRWWFLCPLTHNGRGCWRRCGKLYLPPGGRYFGCRLCYNLTYTSSQDAHKSDGLYRMLAANMGVPMAAIKYAMKR